MVMKTDHLMKLDWFSLVLAGHIEYVSIPGNASGLYALLFTTFGVLGTISQIKLSRSHRAV